MTDYTEMQILALSLLESLDSIMQKKLQNAITRGFWNKIGKPFGVKSISETRDDELKTDLNDIYIKFKAHFENKQLKDLLEEGNKLSGIDLAKLTNSKELKKVSKYF